MDFDAIQRKRRYYFYKMLNRGGTVPSSWEVTIAAGEVASNLTDFPVFMSLADMPAGFWSSVSSDGGNIRVKQSGSVIPFDLVKIDTSAKTGALFFLASTLNSGSDNVFTLDLTGSGLIAAGDPNGRNDCWAAYDLVWIGNGTGDVIDRTGGANAFVFGSAGTRADFNIGSLGAGCGVDFTPSGGNNDCLTFSSRPDRSVYTLGMTAQIDSASIAANMSVMSYAESSTPTVRGGVVARNYTSPDHWGMWDNVNTWMTTPSGISLDAGTPARLHGAYNGSTERKLYKNGALGDTDATITARSGNSFYTIAAAIGGTGGEGFDGKIAYCYSRPEYLSADFIAAEYSNLNAPSSFYSIA